MIEIQKIIGVALVASGLLVNAAWAELPQVQPEVVEIRASSSLSDDAIRYIAFSSLPIEVEIPAEKSPIKVLRQFCGGAYTDTWKAIASEQNPNDRLLETLNIPRKVYLPPCVNHKRNENVVVLEDDDFDTLLKRETGFESTHILKPCVPPDGVTKRHCGKTLRQLTEVINKGVNLDALKPEQTVQLPIKTRPITITLKPGITTSAFLQELKGLDQSETPAQINVNESPIVANFPEKPNQGHGKCSCSPELEKAESCWPFSDERVINILKRSLDKSRESLNRVSVGVIDAGFNGVGATEFPKELLKSVRSKDGSIIFGYSVKSRFTVDDYPKSPDYGHGTAVAKLILGGSDFLKQYRNLGEHIELHFNQVQKAEMISQASSDKSPEFRYSIDVDAVQRGVKKGNGFEPRIVNLSLGSKDEWDAIKEDIKGNPMLLAVVAAGNDENDLSLKAWYPANYGGELGELSNQVITVGAYDGKLKPAWFSNHSNDYIDVWAPGCNIPVSFEKETTPSLFSGTSFATPQVTRSVFLILSLTNIAVDTPQSLKRRTIISADYENGKPFKKGTGFLNIERAISVFDDVIEENIDDEKYGGKAPLITGRWDTDDKNDNKVCKDKDINNNDIERIVPRRLAEKNEVERDNRGPQILYIWYRDSQGNHIPDYCVSNKDGIYYKADSDPKIVTMWLWSEIASLTPAMVSISE